MPLHHPLQGDSSLRVSLLGPLVISVDGSIVLPTGRQVPRLVSLLALRNGAPVRIDTVIDVIWPDSPPAQPRRVALNLVGRMRQILGSGSTLTRQGTVSLVGASTDLDEFDGLCADADRHRREGDTSSERASLHAALTLVRGVPLADWTDDPFFDTESARIQRSITQARLRASRLALDESDHEAARAGAEAVLAEDRLAQEPLGILMAALAASGRVREALAAYQDAKELLAEETGLDPDPGLTELYSEILRSDGSDVSEPMPVPRQLPRLSDHVSVHARERTRARRALSVLDTTSPAIVAVNGCGGIGKSAFAIELAHSMKDCYPDGQLYADLHGNAPGREPLDAGQVVRHFLRSLGSDGEQWSDDETAAAHFRSVTADRRVLIVLDDAHDAAQVRPLLPNGSSCGVIITSRRTLPSLRGAEHMELPFLDFDASRALFQAGVDHPFHPEDRQALDGVLDRCGGLPLALCVAAARFNASEPGSLPGILESLSDETLGLSSFDDGENSLAASLAGSLKDLASIPAGREAIELFAMMALHPGPAISVEIAAALVDRPVPTARHLGELLVRYRLVEQHRAGHFSMHDLVRLFATEEVRKFDQAVTAAAAARMRSAYLAAAAQAYRYFREHVHKPVGRNRLDFASELPGPPVDFESHQEADEWLLDHLPVLSELVRTADETDPRFGGLLFVFLSPPVRVRAGRYSELVNMGATAAAALGTADEPWGVYLHHDLAELQSALGDHAAAIISLDNAERSARRHGRIAEAVGVTVTRVRALQRLGEVDRALDLADQAIAEARERNLGDIAARAGAFRSYLLDLRGEHDAAIAQSARLVADAEAVAADSAALYNSKFLINHAFRLIHGGRAAEGLEFAERAEAIERAHGFEGADSFAEVLWGQAEAHHALGRSSIAEKLWNEAAELMYSNGRMHKTQYAEVLAGQRPNIDPAG